MAQLGKCPKCGGNIVDGKYGAYCAEKCGMYVSKAFGQELGNKEIQQLLDGKKILLKGLVSKKTGNTYDMYIKPDGIEKFSFSKHDGSEASGYRWKFETSFPDKKAEKKEEKNDEEEDISGDVSGENLVADEEPLPFA